MFVSQFYVDGLAHASYLVGGRASCAIVDPKRDVEEYLAAAHALGLAITHVLETHLHADFASGHLELAARTGATVYAPKAGACEFDHVAVADGDTLDVDELGIRVVATPGHTPDGVCYVVTDHARGNTPVAVFSGDTLFVGDVGRPDLFPGKAEKLATRLYESLHEKVLDLPDGCLVYPAHGAGSLCGRALGAMRWSTIGYERLYNVALQHSTAEAFQRALLTGMPEAPDHFARLSEVNRRGPALVSALAPPRPLAASELAARLEEGGVVLDARDAGSFGAGHVPGALHIDARSNFATFAGWLLPPDRPLLLVADSAEQVPALMTQLRRVGLDHVAGYLRDGMGAWINAGRPVRTLRHMTVHELKRRCDARERLTILDVRARAEWDGGHIEGATFMPMPDTRTRHHEIERAPVALLCRTGSRASTAASILQREGVEDLAVVAGGMSAWVGAGYAPVCATCASPHGPRLWSATLAHAR